MSGLCLSRILSFLPWDLVTCVCEVTSHMNPVLITITLQCAVSAIYLPFVYNNKVQSSGALQQGTKKSTHYSSHWSSLLLSRYLHFQPRRTYPAPVVSFFSLYRVKLLPAAGSFSPISNKLIEQKRENLMGCVWIIPNNHACVQTAHFFLSFKDETLVFLYIFARVLFKVD